MIDFNTGESYRPSRIVKIFSDADSLNFFHLSRSLIDIGLEAPV